jgi:hypothetical protein
MALFKIEPAKMSLTNLEYFAAVPDSVDTGSITGPSPVTGSPITASAIPKPDKKAAIIDVYRTFDWTTSPINNAGFDNISKTPFAKLTEYRMNDTSIINSMLYYVKALGDQIGTIGSAATNLGSKVATAAAGADNITKLKNVAASVVDAVVGEKTKQFVEQQLKPSESPWMKPYDGLYSLEQTSFTYFLPYFENDAFNRIESTYVEASFPGLDKMKEVGGNATTFSRILAPGQYIETPKMFALNDGNSPRITIKFPLLNTLSFEGAVKNYQLLWLLAFQNTPQRVNKSVVELPRMYDVHIPGVTFMKFAYIESMHVDFIGVRRRITIPMPTCPNNDPQAEVIMPDAYNVTITLRSTIMNANNMMLENWNNSKPQS